MSLDSATYSLDIVHIDVARNATDDFNLFHDKHRWSEIANNPFDGPIALGFQLECFIEDQVKRYREAHHESVLLEEHQLIFSNYAFNFAGVVRPGEQLTSSIKKSRLSQNDMTVLSNRVVLKNQQGIALIGFKSESNQPLFAQHSDFHPDLLQEKSPKDRSLIGTSNYFYKRKFTTNANAKNFLAGSYVEQSDYIDELSYKICFPETYCTSLISCALLEKGKLEGLDFKRDPMVYTSHKISVNRELVSKLRSDQQLHLIVGPQKKDCTDEKAPNSGLVAHHCFGLNQDKQVLFQGEIQLAPISFILKGN